MFLKAYKRALAVLVKKPVLLWGLSLMAQLLLWIAGIITLPIVALTLVATYLIQAVFGFAVTLVAAFIVKDFFGS